MISNPTTISTLNLQRSENPVVMRTEEEKEEDKEDVKEEDKEDDDDEEEENDDDEEENDDDEVLHLAWKLYRFSVFPSPRIKSLTKFS